MKILLDFTSRATGGGVTFLNSFIFNLAKIKADNIYYLFIPSPLQFDLPSNFNIILVRPYPLYELWKFIWHQLLINNFIKKEKIDLFYGSRGLVL